MKLTKRKVRELLRPLARTEHSATIELGGGYSIHAERIWTHRPLRYASHLWYYLRTPEGRNLVERDRLASAIDAIHDVLSRAGYDWPGWALNMKMLDSTG